LVIEQLQAEDEGEYIFVAGALQTAANLYVEVAYIIPRNFKNTVIPQTHTATFECEVTKENLETHWFRDGVEIVPDEKYEVIVQGLCYRLLIHNCTMTDNCEIVFLAADESVAANLEVKPMDILEDCKDVVESEGNDATFCCVTSGKMQVEWSKDNVLLRNKQNKFVTKQEGTKNYLTVKNVNMEDAGSYTCHIGNAESSAVLYVEVAQIQFISETSINVSAKSSEKFAEIKFQVNKEGVKGQWFHNGLKVDVEEAKYNYIVERTFHKLVIKELTVGDSGEYIFNAGNQKATCFLKVDAVNKKPFFVREMQNAGVELAASATFTCEVDGSPAPVVSFYKKGTQIQESGKYQISQSGNKHTLVIVCATEVDVCQFTATAKNVAGQAMTSADLKIVDNAWSQEQEEVQHNCKFFCHR
jgi:hypothetical protein